MVWIVVCMCIFRHYLFVWLSLVEHCSSILSWYWFTLWFVHTLELGVLSGAADVKVGQLLLEVIYALVHFVDDVVV